MIPDGERLSLEFFFDDVLGLRIGEGVVERFKVHAELMELGTFENAVERVTGMRSARETVCGFVEMGLVVERIVCDGAIDCGRIDVADLDCGCACSRKVAAVGVKPVAFVGIDWRIRFARKRTVRILHDAGIGEFALQASHDTFLLYNMV